MCVLLFCAGATRSNAGESYSTTQTQAYEACQLALQSAGTAPYSPEYGYHPCTGPHAHPNGQSYYKLYTNTNLDNFWFTGSIICPSPAAPPNGAGGCGPAPPTDSQCASRPDRNTPFQHQTASLLCLQGCEYAAVNGGDGGEVLLGPTGVNSGCNYDFNGCPTGYEDLATYSGITVSGSLSTECVPIAGDIDGDGIPNSTDPSPNESGEQAPTDTDGDGVPDSTDSAPTDPNNGKTLEAGETVATSSGGGNCSTPPVTMGDAVGAQIAYQTWSTRCAVERLRTASSTSPSSGLTSGQAADLAAIKNNTDNLKGTATFAEVFSAASASDGTVTVADAHGDPGAEVTTGIETGFNESGFLGVPRTCPNLPTLVFPDFMHAAPMDLDAMEAFQNICAFMAILGKFVLLSAALASIKIYSRVFS